MFALNVEYDKTDWRSDMDIENMKVKERREAGSTVSKVQFKLKDDEPKPKNGRHEAGFWSMTVKIGLCVAALALAFILRLTGVGKTTETMTQAAPTADTMGDLTFVEASNDTLLLQTGKWGTPVAASGVSLRNDGKLLCFTAAGNAVYCCFDGVVLSVGTDETLGDYIRIGHSGGIESVCYGFDAVFVAAKEEVPAGAVLGSVEYGNELYMAIYRDGEALNAVDFIDVSIG